MWEENGAPGRNTLGKTGERADSTKTALGEGVGFNQGLWHCAAAVPPAVPLCCPTFDDSSVSLQFPRTTGADLKGLRAPLTHPDTVPAPGITNAMRL